MTDAWCIRCGKGVPDNSAWCPECHQLVKADIARRQSLAVGGLSCGLDQRHWEQNADFERWGRSTNSVWAYIGGGNRVERKPILDDVNPSQDRAIRELEDGYPEEEV